MAAASTLLQRRRRAAFEEDCVRILCYLSGVSWLGAAEIGNARAALNVSVIDTLWFGR